VREAEVDEVDEYRHGEMNAATQVADYHVFLRLAKWAALHVAVLILFLTLWFCAGAGFLTALIAAVVVLALGIFVLRGRSNPVH
jgi:hypothetical protein